MEPTKNNIVHITPSNLPLECFGQHTQLWNGHPRVFLPIQSNSQIECPYCGTVFQLEGETKSHH